MKKKLFSPLGITTVALLICVGLLLFPVLARSASEAAYKAKWVDGGIQVTVNAPEAGTAYVVVQDSGADAPTTEDVTSSETSVSCEANTDAKVRVSVSDTKAKDVYVQFVPSSSSNTYSLIKMTLKSKASGSSETAGDGATSGSVSYSAVRTSADSITLSVTPTEAGTTYYIVKDASDSAPTDDDFTDSTSSFDCAASSTTTQTISDIGDSSAKVIYLKYKVGDTWYDGISSLTIPAYQTSSVSYSVEWVDSGNIKLTVNPSADGVAYYKVQDQGDSAPTADSVVETGYQLTCTGQQDNTTDSIDVSTSTAKTIYIVYKDTSGNTFEMTSLSLPAYSSTQAVIEGDATPVGSVSFKAERTGDTTITLDTTPTVAGTVHYIVTDADATAPTEAEVIASTNIITCDSANTTVTTPIATTAGAKKLYLRYADAAGVAFEGMEVMDIPAYGTAAYGAKVLEYDPDFGVKYVGYSTAPDAKTFTIQNTGANTLTFSASTSSNAFTTVLDDDSTTIAAGETGTFTIQPVTGLSQGVYEATIELTATSGDTEVLTLDVPVKFTVAERTSAQYYSYLTNTIPWQLNDTTTDEVAFSPVYCINMERSIAQSGYSEKIYFNGYLDADEDLLAQLAGSPYTMSEGGTYIYYKADEDGNGTLDVRSAEDTMKHLKWVLNNGYGSENVTPFREYLESLTWPANFHNENEYTIALYAATQAAIWHFTDYSYSSDPSSVRTLDDYIDRLSTNNIVLSDMWNTYPRKRAAITAIYNALISEDGTYDSTTFRSDYYPGGTLVTDTSNVQANLFENTLVAENDSSYHYQNLISASAPSSTSELTSVTATKIWDDGGTVSSPNRPSATEFASWVHLYNGNTEVTGYTPVVTDNGDGTYTITYEDLPRYDSGGNSLSYSIVEQIPTDSTYGPYETEYGTTAGTEHATVSGTYVAHIDSGTLAEGTHRIWIHDADFGDSDQVVYCFNITKFYPQEDTSALDGTTYTTKITNASNDDFLQYADNASVTDLRARVLSVIYNGYPTNAAGLQGSLSNDQFRAVTQLAIYHFTDGQDYTSSNFTADEWSVYQKLISGDEGVAAGTIKAVPDNYGLTLYIGPSGYQNLLSATAGETTITNTELTSLAFTKTWVGSDSTDLEATIHLYRTIAGGTPEDTGLEITVDGATDTTLATGTGEYASVTYGEDSAWHGVFNNLPAYDDDGNAYVYSIQEDTISGFYSPIISGDSSTGLTVTNISNETRDIRVVKVWNGTPEEVTVNLLADGTTIESVTLDGNVDSLTTDPDTGIAYGEASSWVASFGYLPKYDSTDGHEISYTVTEDSIDSVTSVVGEATTVSSTVTEYIVTNTRTGTVQPTVTKSWAEGVSTQPVTLQLQRYDTSTSAWVDVDGQTVTLNGTQDTGEDWSSSNTSGTGEIAAWQGRFGQVAKFDSDGNEYSYRVVETTTGSWTPSYGGTLSTGFTVTNNASATTSATIQASKVYSFGVSLGSDQYDFQLYASDESWTQGELLQEKQNDSSGTITFDPITYTGAGTHYYLIKEALPEDDDSTTEGIQKDGITYDSSTKYVTVSVTGDSTSGFTAIITYGTDETSSTDVPTFTNAKTTYTSVAVTKTWVGGSDGPVQVQLYRSTDGGTAEAYGPVLTLDGTADGSLTTDTGTNIKLGEDVAWHGTFQNLPATDSSHSYTYSVQEVGDVSGYSSSLSGDASSGFVITNTKLKSVSFKKVWNDNDATHTTADAVTVKLEQRVGTGDWSDTGKTITLDGSETPTAWAGSFTDLPAYDGSTPIEYRVVETSEPDGYVSFVSGSMAAGFTITNTKTTKLSATKQWAAASVPDGASATFQLYRSTDGSKFGDPNSTAVAVDNASVTLDGTQDGSLVTDSTTGIEYGEDTGWTAVFDNLPAYSSTGDVYTYSVAETAVTPSDYKPTYGSINVDEDGNYTQTVANSAVTQVSVTKNWVGATPTTVTINLMKTVNGTTSLADRVILRSGNWTHTFEDLPTYEVQDGVAYEVSYSVEEPTTASGCYAPVYSNTDNDWTVTNTSAAKKSIRVTKTWRGSTEPVTVVLHAKKGSATTDAFTISLTLDGTPETDYQTATYTSGSTAYTFRYREDAYWVGSFENLPKYAPDGDEFTYSVTENAVSETSTTIGDPVDVSSTLTTYSIVNTRSAQIQPTVTKTWSGVSSEGKTVEFGLYKGDSTTPIATVTLNGTLDTDEDWSSTNTTGTGEIAEWKGRFGEHDKYDENGQLIDYQVKEITTSDEYNCAIVEGTDGNYTATNTNKAVAHLSATKTLDGAVPTTKVFTFELYEGTSATGTPVETKTTTDDGEVTFSDLTFDTAGTYTYTIHEVNDHQPGIAYDEHDVTATISVAQSGDVLSATVSYTKNGATSTTATFSNTTTAAEVTDVTVNKQWDGASGDAVYIQLMDNDEPTGMVVELDGSGPFTTFSGDDVQYGETAAWTATFHNLPKNDESGGHHVYSVREITYDEDGNAQPVTNYKAETTFSTETGAFTITNSPSEETVDIPVKKEWADGASGEEAVVALVTNGTVTDQTVTLNADNDWESSFSDLAKYDSEGNEITYSVQELTNTYAPSVASDGNGGFVVTNRPSTETVDIPVQKKWADGASGDKAVVELIKDGKKTGTTITLVEGNQWRGVFEGLPKYGNDGHEIEYSVTEQTSEWTYTVESDGNGGFIVTNYPKDTTVTPSSGNMPKTGDSTPISLLALLAAAGLCFAAFGLHRRRNDA
jgi:pilin isopeptide linkage protein/TQXA domain-containing protein